MVVHSFPTTRKIVSFDGKIQIRNGNYRDKAVPFSTANERAGKKTKQMKNLGRDDTAATETDFATAQ